MQEFGYYLGVMFHRIKGVSAWVAASSAAGLQAIHFATSVHSRPECVWGYAHARSSWNSFAQLVQSQFAGFQQLWVHGFTVFT